LIRAFAQGEIGIDHRFNGVHHIFRREAATGDFANSRLFIRRTAKRDLIELLTLLLDAQNADMADMMVAAGIDAAGNLDLEIADFKLALLIAKALGNALRHRDGARIGKGAIVEAGAGDDVGDETGIGRYQTIRLQE